MIIYYFLWSFGIWTLIIKDFNYVVDHYETTNYDALANLKPIDPSMDIDSIRAENCDVAHVEVIEKAEM